MGNQVLLNFIALASLAAFSAARPATPTCNIDGTLTSDSWNDCSSEPISMIAARVPTNSTSKIGSLFIRFGGPGLYTTSTLLDGAPAWDDEIRKKFDLVVLDNRGTGLNYPVECDIDLWNQDFNYFPQTESEYNTTIDQFARAGLSCVEKTGPVINHMDALTHANDLEALRVALDEPLTIYALSWGSQAISQYAQEFPGNIRAMILDGNEPHFLTNVEAGLSETMNMAFASQRVLGWASTNETSPLYGQDTVQLWRDLIKQIRQKPLHNPWCESPSAACKTKVTGSDLINNMESWSEYASPELFFNVSKCLHELQRGKAECVTTPIYTTESVKAASTTGGFPWTQAAIGCQDQAPDNTWPAYRDWALLTGTQAIPVNKGYHGLMQLTCPKWPTAITNPPILNAPNVNTSASILIVNALWDPATGYDQAASMHRHFPNSVLLTRNGEGHGSWNKVSFPETYLAMRDYLIDLKLPAPNTVLDAPFGTFDVLVNDTRA